MGQIVKRQGAKKFPDLYVLVGGYFHQDYVINGNTLEEVLATFLTEEASYPGVPERVRANIADFLESRLDDTQLNADFERMFNPQVMPQGWEDSITNWRQWLTRVAEILSVP